MSTATDRGRFFSLKRLVIITAVVGLGWAIYEGASRWRLSQLYGGFDRVAMLRNATEVTAWRLVAPVEKQPRREQIHPQEYQLIGNAVELSRGASYELQTLLGSPSSYCFFARKECGFPDYSVKFTFVRGDKSFDVFVCMKCRDLAVVTNDATRGQADFSPAEAAVISIVKELFPEDAEIMALK